MSILLPGFQTSTQVDASFSVAETVIVGDVPESYTYFDSGNPIEEDALMVSLTASVTTWPTMLETAVSAKFPSRSARFENRFSQAGINQTTHRIILCVEVNMSILLPGFQTSTQVLSFSKEISRSYRMSPLAMVSLTASVTTWPTMLGPGQRPPGIRKSPPHIT